MNETCNKAKIKKEIDVLETMNIELEHSVAKLRMENGTLKKHYKDLYDSIKITRSKTIEQITSLLANNADLKSQIQEKVFAIVALKNDLRKLKGNSVDTKFAKTSILGKPVLQSLRNQSVVRQPNAFKSERPQMSKPRFASQVNVNKNLSRPVTQHYLPKRKESIFAKPDHMIAFSESRNSSKNMPRFSSNDMVHNHYLDEARKQTQERDRNSKTSVMPSARSQSIVDGSKPKPGSNNQTPKSLPCVFNANHDACITKLLKEVNSRAKIQSHKTRNSNKLVDQKSHTQKPGRQIFTGHRWIPTGKLFDSCTSKDDSEPTLGSNVDISNIHESKQTLYLSAGTSINVQKELSLDFSAVVSKPFAVTTADASDKRQQQPDSTSSTSTIATTVTPDENFNMNENKGKMPTKIELTLEQSQQGVSNDVLERKTKKRTKNKAKTTRMKRNVWIKGEKKEALHTIRQKLGQYIIYQNHNVVVDIERIIWDNEDVHDLRSVETEFPATVFNVTLTSEAALSCEPTDKDNDDDKIDIEHSFGDLSVKPLPDVINTDVGAYAHGYALYRYQYGVSWGIDAAY
ncbi:hypothetical protein Tco_0776329 [Tanacetum coccineum]